MQFPLPFRVYICYNTTDIICWKEGIGVSCFDKVSVIIPSLDPDEKLLAVVDGLLATGFNDIILVNDGSCPEKLSYFSTAAVHPEVTVLHHPVNRGKGAALKTAFAWFLENRSDREGVVTADGDNQHHPEDIQSCAEHLCNTNHFTLGVRDFSLPEVPFRSRSGNRITSFVFKVFVGMTISDTQTGLRGLPANQLPLFCQVGGDRFEYETNMLLALKEYNIPFDEVKIRTVYIEENKSSHFHAVRDSWRIYKLLLGHFFRYAISSVVSAVLDEGLFALLSFLMQGILTGFALTAVPTGIARLVSSLCNFFINKKLVFQKDVPTGKALLRYYLLAIPVALAQMGLTFGVFALFGISAQQTFLRAVIYGIVMAVLFIFTFLVQQRWVFREK